MLTPTVKKKVRQSIVAWCDAAVRNEPRVHYSQQRPFRFYDDPGYGYVVLDCSGFVVNAFWNTSHDLQVYIADPSGQRNSGYGNTWTMEAWLRQHGNLVTTQPYLVGDIAMFDGHTMICTTRGTAATSRWTSHGSEGGPDIRLLGYRQDLVGVWRHPALL